MIKEKLSAANNKKLNNTFISQLVYSLQILKIIESFIWLISISFFLGVFWIIFCEIQIDYFLDGDKDNFMEYYGFLDKKEKLALSMTYFGTTTLTTIGFGDFHPKSNFERLMCTVLMVIGVATFSLIFS
jgi:hypothetical protein